MASSNIYLSDKCRQNKHQKLCLGFCDGKTLQVKLVHNRLQSFKQIKQRLQPTYYTSVI